MRYASDYMHIIQHIFPRFNSDFIQTYANVFIKSDGISRLFVLYCVHGKLCDNTYRAHSHAFQGKIRHTTSERTSGRAGKIVFEPQYRVQEAIRGLADFSHIWLIFDFSKAHADEWSATVRPPRLGGNTKMGVFATRSPYRPNSLGLSLVKLVGIEHTKSQGDVLVVEGVDLLDGTPIYDIKTLSCNGRENGCEIRLFNGLRLPPP